MIVACHKCSARLQIADEKVPAHDFALRCPKCQTVVSVNVNGHALDASLAGFAPSASATVNNTPSPTFEKPNPPTEKPKPSVEPSKPTADKFTPPAMAENALHTGEKKADSATELPAKTAPATAPPSALPSVATPQPDALQQLLMLLQSGLSVAPSTNAAPVAQNVRRLLIGVAPAQRATLAQLFATPHYQVFVAEDYRQAIAHLREEHQHIIITEPDFAPEDNGYRGLFQAVQAMRPPQRRRTVFVKIAPDARTSDQHSAFLQSVNLLINTADIIHLPAALERNLRHHNELYRDFWQVLSLAPM